jgi:predicted NBD/HSP70 family sugar kinase
MHALGECYFGVGRGVKNFVLLGVAEDGSGSSGLGTALVLNGELIRGNNNMSGEIGHVTISNEGPQCLCGKTGCLEAILKEAVNRNHGKWSGEPVTYIAMAIGMMINILDPGTVVLNGNIIERFGKRFVEEIKSEVTKHILSANKREIRIEKSLLGNDAPIKGICSFIYQTYFRMDERMNSSVGT